ncbi:MAG: hypothetical protein ABI197_04970 [Granulicella sp.]
MHWARHISFAAFYLTATLFVVKAESQNVPVETPATHASATQIIFKFDRPVAGVSVPHYTVELRSDGTGSYHAEALNPQGQTQIIDRPLTFTPPTVKAALAAVQQLRDSKIPCASSVKNIADTGTKTLTVHDPKVSTDLDCTYNFSENKAVATLTILFQYIEETLEQGRILDFKRRFDRLGLDAAMITLVTSVEAGRAIELGNISSTLQSIAANTDLIKRVRLHAANLLERAKAEESGSQ